MTWSLISSLFKKKQNNVIRKTEWWWWRDFLILNNAYKYFCYLRWLKQDRHKVTIYLVFNNDWTILKESHFFKCDV